MSPDQAYRRKAESNRQRYIGIGIGAKFLDHDPATNISVGGWGQLRLEYRVQVQLQVHEQN